MWAFFEIAKSLAASFITSRLGQIVLAAGIAWFWSAHETTVKYEKLIAAEKASLEAAYKAEILRQGYATREIEEAAQRRAEDDAAAAKDMQAMIDDYAQKLKDKENVKTASDECNVDSDFSRVVHQLDHAAASHPRIARRAKRIR